MLNLFKNVMESKIRSDGKQGGDIHPSNIFLLFLKKIINVIKHNQFGDIGNRHVKPTPTPQGKSEKIKKKCRREEESFFLSGITGSLQTDERND